MAYRVMDTLFCLTATLAVTALIAIPIAAWVTHVVYTITAGAYILLAIGTIIAPVGVIHGIMIWFGMPWGG